MTQRKKESEKRTMGITIRFTEDEYRKLRSASRYYFIPMAVLARDIVLHKIGLPAESAQKMDRINKTGEIPRR